MSVPIPPNPLTSSPQSGFTPELRFKQYRLMVESAEHNSDRRERAQTFYTTIHTSLLTLLAIVAGYGLLTANITGNTITIPGTNFLTQAQGPIIFVVSIIGLILCWIWGRHLSAFKRLSTAKFAVINEIEKSLPYQAFQMEWDELKKIQHTDFTSLELFVPWVVAFLYLLLTGTYFIFTQVLTLA